MQFSGVAPGRYELTVVIGSERILKTIDLASNTTLEVSKEQDPPKFTGRITLDGPGSVPGGGIMLRANNVTRYIGLPGADGSITFEPVPSGHYEALLYNAPGFYAKSVSLNGVKAADDFVDVPAPGGFELSVVADHVAAKKLEGIVEHDRKPVAAAMVLLIPEDLSRTSLVRRDQSDSDGSFSLPNVAPGRYRLVAIEGENDLAYRDPAVIKPYLAQGQPVNVEPGFNQRVKVEVAGR